MSAAPYSGMGVALVGRSYMRCDSAGGTNRTHGSTVYPKFTLVQEYPSSSPKRTKFSIYHRLIRGYNTRGELLCHVANL